MIGAMDRRSSAPISATKPEYPYECHHVCIEFDCSNLQSVVLKGYAIPQIPFHYVSIFQFISFCSKGGLGYND